MARFLTLSGQIKIVLNNIGRIIFKLFTFLGATGEGA